MSTTRYKAALDALIAPLAEWVARRGITPNAITLATPLLTALACWWLLRTAALMPFALMMLAIGCLDLLDGAVARASGTASAFGAYLDAMADRYVESLVILAVAWVTGYWVLSLIMLSGSLLVSYAKARAAMEIPISNREWPDLMERVERSACYLGGLVAGAVLPWRPLGRDLFWWMLLLLGVLIHATVVQRVLRARRLIGERSRG